MICPLLAIGRTPVQRHVEAQCEKENCGMWVGQCLFASIAKSLATGGKIA